MQKIILILPARLDDIEVAHIGEALLDISHAHSVLRSENHHRAPWNVEWLVDTVPDEDDLRGRLSVVDSLYNLGIDDFQWRVEDIPEDVNWLEECYRQFPPFSVGPFFIYGSHFEGGVPDGQMGLRIDAATAFGSGEHGTTKGCLQAMLELKAQGQCPWNVLDMGTGSGILGVAAWKLWKTPILAVDKDPESVRVTEVHAGFNETPLGKTELSTACGDGFKTDEVQRKKPFDLVIANILASALIKMVEELVAVMDDNGYVILSGILNAQADDVIKVYEAAGLILKKTYEIGEWSTLVMKK